MLKDMLSGHNPSHFQVNPLVRAFVVAEMMLWSGWNFVTPIFALFAVTIPGGNIETAASAYSAYLLVRVLGELISGRVLLNTGELSKFAMTIFGICILGVSYIGFALTHTLLLIFVCYGVAGFGLGLASPAKNSLFSTHLDKQREALEWGVLDAVVFFCMALASVLGGFIATQYGFQFLFYLAAGITFLGTLPYIIYIKHDDTLSQRLKHFLS